MEKISYNRFTTSTRRINVLNLRSLVTSFELTQSTPFEVQSLSMLEVSAQIKSFEPKTYKDSFKGLSLLNRTDDDVICKQCGK